MRRATIILAGSLAVLAGLLFLIVPHLPDPVATQFGGDGVADGFSSPRTMWPTALGIPAVAALSVAAVTWTRGRRPPEGMRWVTGMPVGVVWGAGGVIIATLLTALVPLVASTRFGVTLGPGGMTVAGPLGGWPGLAVPLDTVTGATTTTIRPFQYGGWGIRMQPGGATTAVVTRSGPALRLDRTDGSAVVVSLEAPEEAAAVVNALLDQRSTPASTGRTGGGRP